ncbi:MAG: hypothetical protein CM15mP103_07970 [Gammaproteobacteria bacterium]|nr:MAG: hypothetical protein CM15mP103_07970 [Gammaproteobacteria bacterium]
MLTLFSLRGCPQSELNFTAPLFCYSGSMPRRTYESATDTASRSLEIWTLWCLTNARLACDTSQGAETRCRYGKG